MKTRQEDYEEAIHEPSRLVLDKPAMSCAARKCVGSQEKLSWSGRLGQKGSESLSVFSAEQNPRPIALMGP